MYIYIAGPMRGLPNYNFAAFDAARDLLRKMGHTPISPADMDRGYNFVTEHDGVIETTDRFSIDAALRHDFAAIANCDAIAFLPGWENSSGSMMERKVAGFLHLPMYRIDPDAGTFEPELIIGFSGYARAGKDTAAAALVGAGYTRHGFADKLKQSLYNLNPLIPNPEWMVDDMRLAELIDEVGWEKAKESGEVRRLCQREGTEAGRDVHGKDLWVNSLFDNATEAKIVIPDVRFPNEAEAIRDRGGLVIRIERESVGPANNHPSETALDDFDFDAIVHNDSTIEALHHSLRWVIPGIGEPGSLGGLPRGTSIAPVKAA